MRATDRHAVQLACLLDGSRMSREVHVRFCERLGVQLPGPTLPANRKQPNYDYFLVELSRSWHRKTECSNADSFRQFSGDF